MKKIIIMVLSCFVIFGVNAQSEFNAYTYSQNFKNWLFNDAWASLLDNQLKYSVLIVFSREDLRILRNYIYAKYDYSFSSADLRNFFSKFKWYRADADNVDDKLTETDKINIQFIQEMERNFPSDNDVEKVIGVWRVRGDVPDQGYTWGDRIIIYPNGIFERKLRNFNAARAGNNIIYGGSRFGLWTTGVIPSSGKNIINITEITKTSGIDEARIINEYWWRESKDVLYSNLDWGTR